MPDEEGDTIVPMEGFGKRLREAIEESGKSMRAISQEAGLSHSHVGAMVHERSIPTLENVAKVAAVLGVTIDWLVTGKGPKVRGGSSERSFDELVDAVADRIESRKPDVTTTVERPIAKRR